MQILPELVKQPNGLPVQHICITIGKLSRYSFVLSQAVKNGSSEKVGRHIGKIKAAL